MLNTSARSSLYIKTKSELLKVLSWVGFIIFWLTSWLPGGFYLGGNSTMLGTFLPELEVVIPIASFGIFLIFISNIFLNLKDKCFAKMFLSLLKKASLFLLILLIVSFFSRDFASSSLFIPIWVISMIGASVWKIIIPDTLNKKVLLCIGVLLGFLVYRFYPDLHVSLDILSLISLFGLMFLGEEIPRNHQSKLFLLLFLIKSFFLYVIFQNGSIAFTLAALVVLIFSQKVFVLRRGKMSPDFLGISVFMIFSLFQLYINGFYIIDIPNVVPGFWGNFREILFGVGQGQFLAAFQENSSLLISLNDLKTPNSSFLLILFEQGVFGVFTNILLFIFAYFLNKRRSFLYLNIIIFLWIFSSVFMASENGIILFMILLFLNKEKDVLRKNS